MGITATKYQKIASGKFLYLIKNFFEFFNFDPKYLEKVPLKILCDFWLNQPSRGWTTRIWPKTGTGSSSRRHFVGKTNF